MLVIGYPQLFPDEGRGHQRQRLLHQAEQQWLSERGVHVNAAIPEAIRRSGTRVEYVDVSDALEGHEVGTDDPWLHDLDLGVDGGGWFTPVSRNSFHPDADGHAAIAAIVRQHVRKGP